MLYYTEAYNGFAGPILASATQVFKEMLQRWSVVANTVSDFVGPISEPQISRSIDKRVISLDQPASELGLLIFFPGEIMNLATRGRKIAFTFVRIRVKLVDSFTFLQIKVLIDSCGSFI